MMNQYTKHIERLQEQNRLLAECLADERRLRKEAYAVYRKRASSRLISAMDMFLFAVNDAKRKG